MKDFFEAPELDIIMFDFDILTDSTDSTGPDEDNVDLGAAAGIFD